MRSFVFISFVLLVSSVATRAGHAELHAMTPAQRDCLNDLLHSLDHRSLISQGSKIQKISFDKDSQPYVSVTIAYDRNDELITRTCNPASQDI
jgi:hypothetical protein